jgi:hypothetical protein
MLIDESASALLTDQPQIHLRNSHMSTTPPTIPAPLPPLSPNAREALLIVTKRYLDACYSTMRAHGYGREIPSTLHSVK